jgi:hypothetical protein
MSEKIVQVIPAVGWNVWRHVGEEKEAWCSEPLIAWGITAGGEMIPLHWDSQNNGGSFSPRRVRGELDVLPDGMIPW